MKKLFLVLIYFALGFMASSQSAFVENKGQVLDFNENFHPEVKFYYSLANTDVYLHTNKLVYHFKDVEAIDEDLRLHNKEAYDKAKANRKVIYHRMDMSFVNASESVSIKPERKVDGVTHFYLNKRNGIRDVASYQKITYNNVYDNIDVVFYSNDKGLKYDIILNPGASLEDVQIKFEGADISIRDNKLYIRNSIHEMIEDIPLSFYDGDVNNKVDVSYVLLDKNVIGFKLNSSIGYSTLTIDPVLEWGTYFNYSGSGSTIDYLCNHQDTDGNYYTYGMGYSAANTYPVTNPGSAYVANHAGSSDAYIVKFNANRQLVWSTYLGGSGSEYVYDGNIITSQGNVLHIVGEAISTGAPFTNGGGYYQATANRNFWARFNRTTGALQHLTSLSSGYKPSIAISSTGLVAISNHAYDFNNLPVLNRSGAYNQATNGGSLDMGLLMFDASYNQIWGTFYGGSGSQENFTCAFDANNNLYFVGETSSNNSLVNLSGAYNQTTIGGGTDVLLGKFNSNGQIVWATLLGGNGSDARAGQQGHGARPLIHPVTNELLLAFNTTSTNLPVVNLSGAYNKTVPTHTDYGGSSGSFWNYAAYICKFSPAGVMNWATYFYTGTGGGDIIENIAFGGCNKFYIGSAGISTKPLTGATGGYNLLSGTGTGRSGMITMLDATTFAFQWDSYLNINTSSEANVAAHINQARFYTAAELYYNNLPTVDPGNGAYYNANNNNPAGAGIGISQFHPAMPPIVSNQTICSGASVNLTVSGGMGAPYEWYASQSSTTSLFTGASFTVSPTTTTTYYVSSGSGMCASPRVPVTVTVTGGVSSPSISVNGPLCAGGNINFTTGAVAGASYHWSGPNGFSSTVQNPTITGATVAASGTYSLYLVVGTCTSAVATTVITVNPIPATPTISSNSPVCVGSTLQLNANTISNGVYYWSGPNGFTSNNEDPSITSVTASAAGVYTLYVEQNSCTSSSATLNVVVNPTPNSPVISSNAPVCAGTSIQLSAPTIAGATYVWTGPNGFTSNLEDPIISNAQAINGGNYSLIIVQGGCSSSASLTNVAVSAAPSTPTITSNTPLCSGSSLLLNTGTVLNATYVWTGPNGFTSNLEDPIITNATNSNSGTYLLTVVVGACSSATASHSVTVNTAPTISQGTIVNPTVCGSNNGSIQINGSGTGNLYWVGVNTGNANSVSLPQTISNLGAGMYDVYFVPVAGCTSNVLNINLVDPNPPATPTITANSPLCEGGTINLTSNTINNAAYYWSGPNGFTSNLEDPVITNAGTAATGTYSVYVVVSGCTSGTATVPVTVNAIPSQPSITTSSPICEGSPLTISTTSVTGGSYIWTGPNGFNASNASNTISNANSSHSGVYTLQLVVNGCTSAVATQNIVVNPTPVLSINASATNVCEGSSVTLTGSGASNLSWDNGIFNGVPFQIFSTTTYTLTGTDANGCSSSEAITINVAGNSTVNVQITTNDADNTICEGASIALTASGAGSYVWLHDNSNSTTVFVTPTQTTVYTVVGFIGICNDTATVTVQVSDSPAYTLVASDTIVCPGSSIQLTAQGIGANVLWNTGETSNTITVSPGLITTYSFTATNAQGCSTSASIQVYPGQNPIFNLNDSIKLCYVGADIHAGNGYASYLWNTGAQTESISVNSAGYYSVVVANSQGCTATDSSYVSFSIFNADAGAVGNQNIVLCAYSNVQLQAQGGTSYEWYGPNNYYSDDAQNELFGITAINVGEYVVNIYNDDNCYITDTVLVSLAPDKDCVEVTELVTPNNDGKNDALTFSFLSMYPNHKLSIYNRWGSLVYETMNYQNNWNGIANTGALVGKGELLPAATYFYIFDPGNGEKPIRGFVELQY